MAHTIDDLNGFEMIELKNKVGGRLEAADGVDTAYALTYIFKKRDDASLTYDDVLGMKFGAIQEYLGLNEDDEIVGDPFDVDSDDDDPKA